jgi:hypothetical protein
LIATVWRFLLGISSSEVQFARRGFPDDVAGIRERLERAGAAFVTGYHAALEVRHDLVWLNTRLDAEPPDLRGFAYEGAAMGLALVDLLTRGNRWREMVAIAPRHLCLMLVGAGWAMARLRLRTLPRFARDLDAVSWPLIWDGYGFHEAFFHPDKTVRRQLRPRLSGYALRAFDQGVGRSLWFVDGASPERITATIATFEKERRSDLWSGAGLACGYAGGLPAEAITALHDRSDRGAFAQGVVFAAAARERAGNSDDATALACATVCRITPPVAAAIADEVLGCSDSYESWRRGVAVRFEKEYR